MLYALLRFNKKVIPFAYVYIVQRQYCEIIAFSMNLIYLELSELGLCLASF